MQSIKISFQDLFEYLNVGNVKNEIEVSSKKIYVPTPYSELVPILGYIKKDNHNIVNVSLENGETFKVSDKHLVFEGGECKQIRNCSSVDCIDGNMKIVDYKIHSTNEDVYDISLDDPHIYITPNGVIHHNTTFLISLAQLLQNTGKRAAIASGEETSDQLAYACERLGASDVDIAHLKNVEEIANAMEHYDLMVVDSFQALRSTDTKLKNKAFFQYAQDLLISKAKETGCVLVFVLHITTAGLPKGGTDIIHAVDVNMKLTVDQNDKTIRIFDVYKNRAGETKKHTATMSGKGLKFVGDVVEPVANDKKVSGKASSNLLTNKTTTMILGKLIGANKVKTYTKNIDTCIKIADECRNIYKHFAK